MCLKPLNPKAEEWRPTPLQPQYLLPHLVCQHSQPTPAPPPPPLQAVQLVAVSPTASHKFFSQLPPQHICYYWHPGPAYQLPHNIYTQSTQTTFSYVSVPTEQYLHKVAEAVTPICKGETPDFRCPNEMNLQLENLKREKEMESPRKSPKNPSVYVKKGMRGANIPPRLRRAARSMTVYNKPPPPPPRLPRKQVWKSKKSAKTHSSNTTIMIKNIPNQLRRDCMLRFIDGYCKIYSLEYDFLYLPMDFWKKNNLGYAFVNFTTAVAANNFKTILQSYKWGVFHDTDGEPIVSRKICEITWARIQGKSALVRRFQNSNFACDSSDFLPVVLDPPRNGTDRNPRLPVTIGRLCGQH